MRAPKVDGPRGLGTILGIKIVPQSIKELGIVNIGKLKGIRYVVLSYFELEPQITE